MKGLWSGSTHDSLHEAMQADFKGVRRMSVISMDVHIKTIIAFLLHNRQMMSALRGRTKINGPLHGGWLTPF